MSAFVESLRRLYKNGKITDAKVDAFVKEKKITEAEAAYIKTGVLN